jgi:hypothetical protein
MTTWRDANEHEFKSLNSVLEGVMTGTDLQIPRSCPACLSNWPSLHMYFHVQPNGRGGVWMWCSNCGIYIHGSLRPPVWWRNLENVELKYLTAMPAYLETFAEQIDQHWTKLVRGLSEQTAC